MKNLQPTEYPVHYTSYVNEVKSLDVVEVLEENLHDFVNFITTIPSDKHEYRYLPGKWTIKEIILHIVDAERIFAYRALRFARFDTTPLAGFEENDYVPISNANNRDIKSLLVEFVVVRKATIALFENFTDEMLLHKGIASNGEISVRALGFIISGHCMHHQNVIRERYL
ncbi:MAG: DinB family protein [Flavobacterium sp.]|nr:DinB family protein [Flavobacterium sp.]